MSLIREVLYIMIISSDIILLWNPKEIIDEGFYYFNSLIFEDTKNYLLATVVVLKINIVKKSGFEE
jgi:hypothetical protein